MSNFTIDVVIHADPALMGLLSRLGEQRSPEAGINPPAPAAQIPQTAPAAGIPVTPSAAGIPVTPSAADPVQNLPAVPTSVPQYTFDMIQTACAECMDKGQAQQLQGLLQKFGIRRIPELRSEQYGAFATELRGLGARI